MNHMIGSIFSYSNFCVNYITFLIIVLKVIDFLKLFNYFKYTSIQHCSFSTEFIRF
jgi:hypothetical protein